MTSCLSFAKSSRCQFVSKALRLFNSQRSGRFVVAQQSVPDDHRDNALDAGDSAPRFAYALTQIPIDRKVIGELSELK
jgi:hypothetical protein